MIHLYMIYYDEHTAATIPDGFKRISNIDPSRPELFEIEPILKHLTESIINDNDYYGFISPRFFTKTGLSPHEILAISESKLGAADIVSFSPRPLSLSKFRNSIIQADHSHGDFIRRFRLLIDNIDPKNIKKCDAFISHRVPQKFFLLSHYFLAKGAFWNTWAQYISSSLHAEATDHNLRILASDVCPYPGRDGKYRYAVFLLERLAGFIAFSNKLQIREAFLMKRCIFDFENSSPKPTWARQLAKPIYRIEKCLRGPESSPFAGLTVLTRISSAQFAIRRAILRALTILK